MGKPRPHTQTETPLADRPRHSPPSPDLTPAPRRDQQGGPASTPASERMEGAPATPSYIPRFLVRPQSAGSGDLDVSGSYRFPTRPSPVIGASITLMGLDRVERASTVRPTPYAYRCAHMGPAGEQLGPMQGTPARRLRTRRWPKV